jgi:hypothetical protein
MIPRNPNKPPKVKKEGAELALALANQIKRKLKQIPVEGRDFAFALVRSNLSALEKRDAVAATEAVAAEGDSF